VLDTFGGRNVVLWPLTYLVNRRLFVNRPVSSVVFSLKKGKEITCEFRTNHNTLSECLTYHVLACGRDN